MHLAWRDYNYSRSIWRLGSAMYIGSDFWSAYMKCWNETGNWLE